MCAWAAPKKICKRIAIAIHGGGNIGELQMMQDGGVIVVEKKTLLVISDAAPVISTPVVSA